MIMIDLKRFSLIELLVVTSIFLVVLSLLQPSLVSMLSSAHRVECSQNLKIHGQAVHLYADDEDDIINLTWVPGAATKKRVFDPPILQADGTYRNNITGWFHDGTKGYLEPYMGDEERIYVCPGSHFDQGAEAFSAPGQWVHRTSTYTSTSRITLMKKKRHQYSMFTDHYDRTRGWDQVTQKVLLFDPIRVPTAWVVSGAKYDLTGAKIHNNIGVLPVLMLDGHVEFFDRLDMQMQPTLDEFVNRIYDQL